MQARKAGEKYDLAGLPVNGKQIRRVHDTMVIKAGSTCFVKQRHKLLLRIQQIFCPYVPFVFPCKDSASSFQAHNLYQKVRQLSQVLRSCMFLQGK